MRGPVGIGSGLAETAPVSMGWWWAEGGGPGGWARGPDFAPADDHNKQVRPLGLLELES